MPLPKLSRKPTKIGTVSELNCRKTTLANLWLGHQFTFGVVTWYVDIFIGQSMGTQNVTRRATMQETQTNGQTFNYALISMSNLKLLCRMDSIADVKRFVN